MGGVGGYTLFRYGFDYELVQSIGMGVIGTFTGIILSGIYYDMKHRKNS